MRYGGEKEGGRLTPRTNAMWHLFCIGASQSCTINYQASFSTMFAFQDLVLIYLFPTRESTATFFSNTQINKFKVKIKRLSSRIHIKFWFELSIFKFDILSFNQTSFEMHQFNFPSVYKANSSTFAKPQAFVHVQPGFQPASARKLK